MSRLIDISTTLRVGVASDPPMMLPEIAYSGHAQGALEMAAMFAGLSPADLPDGEGWAVERVRITGTDAWSWDAPFPYTARRFAETKDVSLLWEGHKAGRARGYCHLEKLGNLEALPSTGFTVSCFPVKIERASAGWTRAVAILD